MKVVLPPSPQPNGVRAFIAVSMVTLLGACLMWVLVFPAPEKSYSQDIMLVLITALVTKFGTVIDWHFGSSKDRDGPKGTEKDPVHTEAQVVNPPGEPVPVAQTPAEPVLPAVTDPFTEPTTTGPLTTGDG